MALIPQSGESFAREVDENLRRDQAAEFARRFGRWLVLGFVLLLAAIGGFIYWQHRQDERARQQSEELNAVLTDIGENRTATVPARLERLAASGNRAYRASALLTQAALALERNDRADAIRRYSAIAADSGMPRPYRDAATIRATALEYDALKPANVIARLAPLAKPGGPWFGSAGEMTALAMLKQGRRAEAARLFARIARDSSVPGSIRDRAMQMAGSLGVDASAAMPQAGN